MKKIIDHCLIATLFVYANNAFANEYLKDYEPYFEILNISESESINEKKENLAVLTQPASMKEMSRFHIQNERIEKNVGAFYRREHAAQIVIRNPEIANITHGLFSEPGIDIDRPLLIYAGYHRFNENNAVDWQLWQNTTSALSLLPGLPKAISVGLGVASFIPLDPDPVSREDSYSIHNDASQFELFALERQIEQSANLPLDSSVPSSSNLLNRTEHWRRTYDLGHKTNNEINEFLTEDPQGRLELEEISQWVVDLSNFANSDFQDNTFLVNYGLNTTDVNDLKKLTEIYKSTPGWKYILLEEPSFDLDNEDTEGATQTEDLPNLDPETAPNEYALVENYFEEVSDFEGSLMKSKLDSIANEFNSELRVFMDEINTQPEYTYESYTQNKQSLLNIGKGIGSLHSIANLFSESTDPTSFQAMEQTVVIMQALNALTHIQIFDGAEAIGVMFDSVTSIAGAVKFLQILFSSDNSNQKTLEETLLKNIDNVLKNQKVILDRINSLSEGQYLILRNLNTLLDGIAEVKRDLSDLKYMNQVINAYEHSLDDFREFRSSLQSISIDIDRDINNIEVLSNKLLNDVEQIGSDTSESEVSKLIRSSIVEIETSFSTIERTQKSNLKILVDSYTNLGNTFNSPQKSMIAVNALESLPLTLKYMLGSDIADYINCSSSPEATCDYTPTEFMRNIDSRKFTIYSLLLSNKVISKWLSNREKNVSNTQFLKANIKWGKAESVIQINDLDKSKIEYLESIDELIENLAKSRLLWTSALLFGNVCEHDHLHWANVSSEDIPERIFDKDKCIYDLEGEAQRSTDENYILFSNEVMEDYAKKRNLIYKNYVLSRAGLLENLDDTNEVIHFKISKNSKDLTPDSITSGFKDIDQDFKSYAEQITCTDCVEAEYICEECTTYVDLGYRKPWKFTNVTIDRFPYLTHDDLVAIDSLNGFGKACIEEAKYDDGSYCHDKIQDKFDGMVPEDLYRRYRITRNLEAFQGLKCETTGQFTHPGVRKNTSYPASCVEEVEITFLFSSQEVEFDSVKHVSSAEDLNYAIERQLSGAVPVMDHRHYKAHLLHVLNSWNVVDSLFKRIIFTSAMEYDNYISSILSNGSLVLPAQIEENAFHQPLANLRGSIRKSFKNISVSSYKFNYLHNLFLSSQCDLPVSLQNTLKNYYSVDTDRLIRNPFGEGLNDIKNHYSNLENYLHGLKNRIGNIDFKSEDYQSTPNWHTCELGKYGLARMADNFELIIGRLSKF